MGIADDRDLVSITVSEKHKAKEGYMAILRQNPRSYYAQWRSHGFQVPTAVWRINRKLLPIYLATVTLWTLWLTCSFFFDPNTRLSLGVDQSGQALNALVPSPSDVPFTGAFEKFPRISTLPARQRRMTIVGVWNDDWFPDYLRQFFYGIQLNADVLDLVFINRKMTPGKGCLDFDKEGVDIKWGKNIKFVCMDELELKRRHVDFFCSKETGWDCNPTEYEEVTAAFAARQDPGNYNWKVFRGYVFRDLFINPDNPFWAWMDQDLMLGNFARYPFNILSQVSFLTGSHTQPEYLFMAGQLTAFNFDDPALATAWKKFPHLQTANHFTKDLKGKMPDSPEEYYWTWGYMQSNRHLPGEELSYAVYPDIHGDDYYDGSWKGKYTQETFLLSGRDILLASNAYDRIEIEDLFRLERDLPIDDLGSIGWTAGQDASAYILKKPNLTPAQAQAFAVKDAKKHHLQMHEGMIEDVEIQTKTCKENFQGKFRVCVEENPFTVSSPPLMRSTVVRFKGQQPNHLLRRLEWDERPRGYQRKLLKHTLVAKKWKWFELPKFDITEDMVLRYNRSIIEVWKMGPTRNETLFMREITGKIKIG